VAHQLVCAYVLSTARVDSVWMLPTFKHPFDKQLAPFADRVAMCERAAAIFGGRVQVSRIEGELGGDSYTLRTVKALMARHPGDRFQLVIGNDLVAEREKWHGWEELRTLIDFIVVGRGENGSGVAMPPVSSTEVRARLERGEPVGDLVDAHVLEYIRTKGLYERA
jgi:nicotinate-nucleotide adenylyltransferase